MFVPDHLIKGLKNSTRPVVLYRNERGDVTFGFVLCPDEFVTSIRQLADARKTAGLPSIDDTDNPL
ncbi:hypothetical protein ACOZXQ_000561 [Cronobacter malonaticus]